MREGREGTRHPATRTRVTGQRAKRAQDNTIIRGTPERARTEHRRQAQEDEPGLPARRTSDA